MFFKIQHPGEAIFHCRLAHIALQEQPSRNAIWAKRQCKMTHIAWKENVYLYHKQLKVLYTSTLRNTLKFSIFRPTGKIFQKVHSFARAFVNNFSHSPIYQQATFCAQKIMYKDSEKNSSLHIYLYIIIPHLPASYHIGKVTSSYYRYYSCVWVSLPLFHNYLTLLKCL